SFRRASAACPKASRSRPTCAIMSTPARCSCSPRGCIKDRPPISGPRTADLPRCLRHPSPLQCTAGRRSPWQALPQQSRQAAAAGVDVGQSGALPDFGPAPMVPLSILDLAPIVEGQTAADALRNSLDLCRHAEQLGYTRYWVAEHHNMKGIASAATAVVIGHLAGGTSKIRVGAGGVMLPNHAPGSAARRGG